MNEVVQKSKKKRGERGVALIMTLMALLILSAVAFGLMYMADTETSINSNFRATHESYAAAYAGMQNVRERIMLGAVPPHGIAPPINMPGGAGSVIYVTNPRLVNGAAEVVGPTTAGNRYFDTELCHEAFAGLTAQGMVDTGLGVPCNTASNDPNTYQFIADDVPYTGTAGALAYKWVRITLKSNRSTAPYYANGTNAAGTLDTQVCWDGLNQTLVSALGAPSCRQNPNGTTTPPPGYTPVFLLTAMSMTPTGARRVVQAEVAYNPPFYTNAAVDSQDHVTLNGQLTVNGYDNCTCACTTTKQGGKDVTKCVSRPGQVCDKDQYAIYSASNVDNPGASETVVAGTGTPEGSQPIAQNQPWTYDIQGLMNRYKSSGTDVTKAPYNWTCTGTPADCGNHPSPTFGIPPNFPPTPPDNPAGPPGMGTQITYIPGNVQLTSSAQGNGILIVDGDLDIHGGMQFYGLIIVRGVVKFTGGGADKTNIIGSVLAGQESLVDTVLGGSAVIQFDNCALSRNLTSAPPTMISFRELSY